MTMFISGAMTMAYIVIAAYFFRFWRQASDRLFAYFGLAFLILGVQRVALSFSTDVAAHAVGLYGLRLLGYLIILAAIIDKNRPVSQR